MALGGHNKKRVARVMHPALRQKRLIMGGGGAIGHGVEIIGSQDQHHAGRAAHRVKVKRDIRMGRSGKAEGQMQRARRAGQIIHVARSTRHMQAGRVMGQRAPDTHARTSSVLVATP